MLALFTLVLAPLEFPADGWISFEQPAVEGTARMGCFDGEASLEEDDSLRVFQDRDASGGMSSFDRFRVFIEFENGEARQVRGYTPDCRVVDAGKARAVAIDAAAAVKLLDDLAVRADRDLAGDLAAMLAHIDHGDATDVLERMAAFTSRDDEDALFWLATRRGERGRGIVREHLDAKWPPDHRERAVMALALSEHPDALDAVRTVARSADEPELRARAVTALGIVNAPGALADLNSIFLTDAEDDVRTQAIFALAQLNSKPAAEILAGIVRDPHFAEHRREALFWLADMRSEESQAVLDELVDDIFRRGE